jgi:nucleotide-binding universal stress UspA family protein
MKRILVPTDFSEHSDNALSYALAIANAFGSELTLLHLYKVYSTSGMFVSIESYMKEDAAAQMLERVRKIEARLEGEARIVTKIGRGEAVNMIAEIAEKSDHDLIIMGTKGASGLEEIFVGSTTNGVLKQSRRPVLAIPGNFKFRILRNIVLTLDEGTISHVGILMPLVKLARRFGARVLVYHKDAGPKDAGMDSSIQIFLDDVKHSFHYQLDSDRLNKSINDFVKENSADLLCMIRRQRGFLKEIFHVSTTTKEVFDSPVPLLVLHDVEG